MALHGIKVYPLHLNEYEAILKLVEQSEVRETVTVGNEDIKKVIEASRKERGGFGLFLQGDDETTEPEGLDNLTLVGAVFGQQFESGAWFTKHLGSAWAAELMVDTLGVPVFITTGLWLSKRAEGDTDDYVREAEMYFSHWNCAMNLGFTLKQASLVVGATVKGVDNVNGRQIRVLRCNDAATRTAVNIGILSSDSVSEQAEKIMATAGAKRLTAGRRAEENGGTAVGIARGYLLYNGSRADAYQIIRQWSVDKSRTVTIAWVYGITITQAVEFGVNRLKPIVQMGTDELVLTPSVFKEMQLEQLYMQGLARATSLSYDMICELYEENPDNSEEFTEDLRELCKERNHTASSGSGIVAESHEDMLARLWRGNHDAKTKMPEEIEASLIKKGVGRYLIELSWEVAYDYNNYVGRLIWLRRILEESSGVSIEEYVRCTRLNIRKLLRQMQFNVSADEVRGYIRNCYEPLNARDEKSTVLRMVDKVGVPLKSYLQYYRYASQGVGSGILEKLTYEQQKSLYDICKKVSEKEQQNDKK